MPVVGPGAEAEVPRVVDWMHSLSIVALVLVVGAWTALAAGGPLLVAPPELAAALQAALGLPAGNPGQVVAQREIVTSLQAALDARRQRIMISASAVNWRSGQASSASGSSRWPRSPASTAPTGARPRSP